MSLGNNFYNARKKSGLSQEEVAGKLGISRQTVSKWEKDILANVWKNRKNNSIILSQYVYGSYIADFRVF